jgi:hypothetical protein
MQSLSLVDISQIVVSIFTVIGVIGALWSIKIGLQSLKVAIESLNLVRDQLINVERNQKAASTQNIAQNERELWFSVLEDTQLSNLFANHVGITAELLNTIGITAEQALKICLFFRQYENIYYHRTNDMLPPDLWEHWNKSMRHTFSDERIQTLFDEVEIGYSESFKKYIQEELIPSLPKQGIFNPKNGENKKSSKKKANLGS